MKSDCKKNSKSINISQNSLNEYRHSDNTTSFQLIFQVMLCIEDFLTELFVVTVYLQIHTLCGLQKTSKLVVVGGYMFWGLRHLDICLLIMQVNKDARFCCYLDTRGCD